MFTPTEIEALPSAMEQLYRSLQLNIMSDLTERLKANGEEITSAADWQINRLYELGVSKDEIDSLIQNTLDVSDDEIDRIYDEVVKSGYARNEELYTGKGKEYIPYAENEQLQQLVKAVKNQTKSEYRNITGSLGFAVRNADNTLSFTPLADFYQRSLDNGLMQIASGAVDYNTVLKKAVKAMTDSGLRTVDYASGWSNRVDVAARRALMTGFNQVVAKVNEDNAEQLDTEYFEVSYHRGARPAHQVWQGRVYSKKELETVCGLGTVTGLCGANCYHSYSPFMKGIDTPTYSEEELDRMNEEENMPKEYNGRQYTAYEAQQRQRQLETAMRADRQKIELLTQGGADDDTITGAKAKYFQRQDEYVKFSKAMGLPQQWERITVDGKNALGSKLPKKAGNINKISGDTVEKSVDYMSKSFRPKFSPPSSIDFNNNSIKIKKVENSKFDIVTDIDNTRRNKAVRLTEKLLDSISNNLPVEMELPKVAVIDFEKNNFGTDAIGGYDKSTGILYINSKYDTASKIISYVNKQKDMFANKTEFAPLLHELGHKYYYDCIKNLAKVKNIEYNKAKDIIDEKILSYIQNKGISKNLDTLISEYAQSGYDRHKYTEIVAEVFTVPEKELASDLINLVGE